MAAHHNPDAGMVDVDMVVATPTTDPDVDMVAVPPTANPDVDMVVPRPRPHPVVARADARPLPTPDPNDITESATDDDEDSATDEGCDDYSREIRLVEYYNRIEERSVALAVGWLDVEDMYRGKEMRAATMTATPELSEYKIQSMAEAARAGALHAREASLAAHKAAIAARMGAEHYV